MLLHEQNTAVTKGVLLLLKNDKTYNVMIVFYVSEKDNLYPVEVVGTYLQIYFKRIHAVTSIHVL